jgi:hypothetical protein
MDRRGALVQNFQDLPGTLRNVRLENPCPATHAAEPVFVGRAGLVMVVACDPLQRLDVVP